MSRRRKILLVVSVLLWAAIDLSFIFVVPIFAAMFADFEAPLPAMTQAFIDIAWFSKRHTWFFVPLFYGTLAGVTIVAVKKERKRFAIVFATSALLAVSLLVVALSLPVIQLGSTAAK